MRDELASRLLATVMDWGPEELATLGAQLQALARLKYDEYERFGPGERFLESFAAWLWQMEPSERAVAAEFVLDDLVLISRAELDHSIESVYPDILEPWLRTRTAGEIGLEPYRVARIAAAPEFRALLRKTLVLGLEDGARLDRLRRAVPQLSHEQFHMSTEFGDDVRDELVGKLAEALDRLGLPGPPLFRAVVLVNDFSGSGYTNLRERDGKWSGKLWDVAEMLEDRRGVLVDEDCTVCVVQYIATEKSVTALREQLAATGLDWHVVNCQQIPDSASVSDAALLDIAERYLDPALVDEHLKKGGGPPHLGFGSLALPVVLPHNTPNNSISLLWADSRDLPGSLRRRALFPRQSRHSAVRP